MSFSDSFWEGRQSTKKKTSFNPLNTLGGIVGGTADFIGNNIVKPAIGGLDMLGHTIQGAFGADPYSQAADWEKKRAQFYGQIVDLPQEDRQKAIDQFNKQEEQLRKSGIVKRYEDAVKHGTPEQMVGGGLQAAGTIASLAAGPAISAGARALPWAERLLTAGGAEALTGSVVGAGQAISEKQNLGDAANTTVAGGFLGGLFGMGAEGLSIFKDNKLVNSMKKALNGEDLTVKESSKLIKFKAKDPKNYEIFAQKAAGNLPEDKSLQAGFAKINPLDESKPDINALKIGDEIIPNKPATEQDIQSITKKVIEEPVVDAPVIKKPTIESTREAGSKYGKMIPKPFQESNQAIANQGQAGTKIARMIDTVANRQERRMGNAAADIGLDPAQPNYLNLEEGKAVQYALENKGTTSKEVAQVLTKLNPEMYPTIEAAQTSAEKVMTAATKTQDILKTQVASEAKKLGMTIKSKSVQKQARFAEKKYKTLLDEYSQLDEAGTSDTVLAGKARQLLRARQTADKLTNSVERAWEPRQDYFPRQILPDMLDSMKDRRRALQYMVETGQAKTETQAETMLKAYMAKGQRRARGLEFSREIKLPDDFYEQDQRNVLSSYLADSLRRLEEVKYYGKEDENIAKLVQQVRDEGGDHEYVQRAFDTMHRVTNQETPPAVRNAVRTAVAAEVVTKMSLSALTNAGQTINTATVVGVSRLMKSVFKFMSKEGRTEIRDFALRSGTTTDQALKETFNTMGATSKFAGAFLDKLQFTRVERFNREVSSWAGKLYAEDMFMLAKNSGNKQAMAALKKMGFNTRSLLNKDSLSKVDLQRASQNIVNRTQFKTRVQDLPLFVQSPAGRIVFQLKSFAFKHGQFMRDEIFKQARKGNVKPLLTFGILAMTAGEAITSTKAFVRGEERTSFEEDPLGRAIDNFSNIGGIGMVSDAIRAMGEGEKSMLGLMGGPLVSDIAKAGENIGNIPQIITGSETKEAKKLRLRNGENLSKVMTAPQRQASKFVLQQIPVAGPAASNLLIPAVNKKKKKTTSTNTGSFSDNFWGNF